VGSNESFDFAGPAGRLEAILMLPEAPPAAAAVVCHAHPLQGGMMHFKVVFRAAKALQSAGLAALRFNFRGVGRSEGAYDHGAGEQEDARAALFELQDRFPALPLVLGGFSFGSGVALRVAARDRRVRAVLAVGYPIALEPDRAHLEAITVPRLFVQGEQDPFGPGESLRAMAEALPPPRKVVVIPGADHFFDGHLDVLQGAVADWAGASPWERREQGATAAGLGAG
jgi:alpha/beta superfamily hydrolase